MGIILLIGYLWLGVKSITFIRTKVFKLNYIFIGSFSNYFFGKIFYALFLGWLTIPIWAILSLLGKGRNN